MLQHEKLSRHEIDAELAPILAAQKMRALSRPPLEAVTPAEMRVRAAAEFTDWNADRQPAVPVEDLVVRAPHRDISVRIYNDSADAGGRALIWLHGGGWVIGDLELEDAALRRLARASGVRIISIDYLLAPEHPFPAAIEDAEAVYHWLLSQGPGTDAGACRIGIGGASAGANLALGTALRLRDGGRSGLSFLLLMYGAYASKADSESYQAFGEGQYGLPAAAMHYFWHCYAASDEALTNPYVSPLEADLSGLPPTFVNYAELDILRDDSVSLVKGLRAAGVAVGCRGYAGAIHGFTQYAKASKLARRALDEAGAALRTALS